VAAILNPSAGVDTARRKKSDNAGIDRGLRVMSLRLTLCGWNPVPRMICAQVCEYAVAGGELGQRPELRGQAPAGELVAHVGLGDQSPRDFGPVTLVAELSSRRDFSRVAYLGVPDDNSPQAGGRNFVRTLPSYGRSHREHCDDAYDDERPDPGLSVDLGRLR
jgi:hypothetical protein